MIRKFYRVLFGLTGDDRLVFESITCDAEAIERVVAVGIRMWRGRLREVTSDPLTCRQLFAMRVLLAASRVGVRGSYSSKVSAAFALFLTDRVEQRVAALDLEMGREDVGVPAALSAGNFVEMWKVSASARPMAEPGDWERWGVGRADNAGSLPVGYAMHGVLLKPLQVGAPIRLLRVRRNGITAIGQFTSTTVVAIHPAHLVETTNSIYVVRPADITSAQGEETT